jgi:hypothetical protein
LNVSCRIASTSNRLLIALVKRENRADEGRAGGRKTRVGENLLGRVNGAGGGLGNGGGTGSGVALRLGCRSS